MATDRQNLNSELKSMWLLTIEYIPHLPIDSNNHILVSEQGKIMTEIKPPTMGDWIFEDILDLASLHYLPEGCLFNEIVGKIPLVEHFFKSIVIKNGHGHARFQVNLSISHVCCLSD